MSAERAVGFEDLRNQLRVTNKLLALLLQRTHEFTQSQLILEISKTGAPPSEIAAVMGTTANTVQVALSRGRMRARREDAKVED